jgi:DNA-binding PadR family transcriptional regulator
MNLTRLVALGLLAERGARHGHQLRRDVEIMKADEWAGVGAGSLNREIRQMAADGLIEAVRTERVGRRPERTIYQITGEGRRELAILRERAIGRVDDGPDPVAAGLIFAGTQNRAALPGELALHRRAVEAELDRLAAERDRGMREGYLQPLVSPLQAAAFRRGELRMQAELAWHRECDPMLAGQADAGPPGPGTVGSPDASAAGSST